MAVILLNGRDSIEWQAFVLACNTLKSVMRKNDNIFFNKSSSYLKSSNKFWSLYQSVVKTKKCSSENPGNNLKSDDGSIISEKNLIIEQ